MKSDLDRLMRDRNLAAVIVLASHNYSAPLDYLTGGVAISGGFVVKAPDAAPFIVANPMETEEAASSGLEVLTPRDLGYHDLLKSLDGDARAAQVLLWGKALERANVTEGRVGLYGEAGVHEALSLVQRLNATLTQYQFVGEDAPSLFEYAAITKDRDELARLFKVAERTNEVMAATRDFIASHRASPDELVVNADGVPLTIGAVKRFVRHQLLDRDLEEQHMIFAQGRDAGYPHSRGEESQVLRMGQSIVFDLFPREYGGGYFHDMTRTWSIGYATDEVLEAYHQVMEAFDLSIEMFGMGKPCHLMQEAVQAYFEERGHQTARTHPGTQQGYVHSLGHGIGLNIHESPRISHLVKDDTFAAGNVITIEPGLYYPERGFGIRIEDAFYVTDDGRLVSLTPMSKDLIVPLRGA